MTTKVMLALAGAAVAMTSAAEARPIRMVGSVTVYPFAKAVAEQFVQKNRGFQPPVIEGTGTGAGFKLFCAGVGARHPDFQNASRRAKASEIAQCKSNGVTQIAEIQIGLDGVAFATAKRSQSFTVTNRDIYAAIAATPYGKPNRARTWRDVNPKLPALPIVVYGPSSISGTRDALSELIMTSACKTDPATAAMEKANADKFKLICTKVREDGRYVETGDNPNLIVQKLEANPNTVGIFGYGYVEENGDKLKALPVNGVAPSYETISTFKYIGARPLYVYAKLQHARAVPGMKEYLTEFSRAWRKGGYLSPLGLVSAPPAVQAQALKTVQTMAPTNLSGIK